MTASIFYSPPLGGSGALTTIGQITFPPHILISRSIDLTQDALDLAAKKVAHIGTISWEDQQSHVISAAGGGKIVAWTGVTTFANASTTLRVGLQDVDTTVGNGPRPDGTFDVSRDFVGGTDTITGSARVEFSMTGGSGSKTLAHGANICAVFDMISRGGTDSVLISVKLPEPFNHQNPWPTYNAFNATSWTKTLNVTYWAPNVYFIADDGAIGIFEMSPMISGSGGNVGWDSATSPNERGILITIPKKVKVIGIWAYSGIASSTGGNTFKIYSDATGTPTLVASIAPSAFWYGRDGATGFQRWRLSSSVELAAGDYAVTQLATTSGVNSLQQSISCVNESLQAFAGYPRRVTRHNSTGAFTVDSATTATIPALGLIIEAV